MKREEYFAQSVKLKKDRPQALRVVGEMTGADENMHQAIFLGTYPGLTKDMLANEVAVIRECLASRKAAA
jgi:CDP-6-deoxy-D-xylo-4-hexulose-3-dehydrase